MQFHGNLFIYLFDFTSFFAWTFLNFLARCVFFGHFLKDSGTLNTHQILPNISKGKLNFLVKFSVNRIHHYCAPVHIFECNGLLHFAKSNFPGTQFQRCHLKLQKKFKMSSLQWAKTWKKFHFVRAMARMYLFGIEFYTYGIRNLIWR